MSAYAAQLVEELLDLLPEGGAELLAPAADSGYQRFREMLGPEQISLIDDTAALVAADPGRRAGKTTAVINHHQRAAMSDDWERKRLMATRPTLTQSSDGRAVRCHLYSQTT